MRRVRASSARYSSCTFATVTSSTKPLKSSGEAHMQEFLLAGVAKLGKLAHVLFSTTLHSCQ